VPATTAASVANIGMRVDVIKEAGRDCSIRVDVMQADPADLSAVALDEWFAGLSSPMRHD
jgi:hypothetical protein